MISYRKKDLSTTKKDRVTHCLTICENIVAQSLRYAVVNGRTHQIKDNQIWSCLMSHWQKPVDAEAKLAFSPLQCKFSEGIQDEKSRIMTSGLANFNESASKLSILKVWFSRLDFTWIQNKSVRKNNGSKLKSIVNFKKPVQTYLIGSFWMCCPSPVGQYIHYCSKV